MDNVENNDFIFSYSAPTIEERKEIESIRKNYTKPTAEENKLERLRKLDFKVKNIPIIISLILGIVGTLIFGLGLSMILEWYIVLWGVIVCIVGLFPIFFAYPAYRKQTKKLKSKYSEEILSLSDELLGNGRK